MEILPPKIIVYIKNLMYRFFTKVEFEEFLYNNDIDIDSIRQDYSSFNKGSYMFEILKDYNDTVPGEGDPTIIFLVKNFLKTLKSKSEDEFNKTTRVLAEYGIIFNGIAVTRIAGDLAKPAEEENYLFMKLKELDFKEVITFLKQSQESYIDEKFEASNAMTRTAYEVLLKLVATDISTQRVEEIPVSNSRAKYPQPIDYRTYLKHVNFFNGNEFNLINAFYQYSSTKGSHSGLSDESDCRLRRFMMIGLCLKIIEKHIYFSLTK